MQSILTVKLSDGCSSPLSLVGAKARNLMTLVDGGTSVPEAFCVTTNAYRSVIARNDSDGKIADLLATVRDGNKPTQRAASRQVRQALLNGTIPDDVVDAIAKHYRELSDSSGESCPVAVRSSGTAEDLAEASFAGAQATVLNVRGLPAVLDAVRICWASLWTERVASYRACMSVGDTDLALAVIVQRMISSQVSGVLFTLDPVSGDRDCLVVEACRGLGEALVAGKTIPDHYELERATFRVRTKLYGRQSELLECGEEGVRTVSVPDSVRRGPCLAEEQLRRLCRLGLVIENQFGSPQDIEWAIDEGGSPACSDGKIYVLQTRPITTCGMPSTNSADMEEWKSPVRGAIWARQSGGIVEHLSAPASPFFATAQLPLICDLLDAQCPEMGIVTPTPTYTLINGYFYNRSDYRLGSGALFLFINYWKAARKGAKHWRQQMLPSQSRFLSELSSVDLSSADAGKLIRHIRDLLHFNAKAWDDAIRASRTYVFTEPLFRRIFDRFIRPLTGGDAVTFLRGFQSQIMAGEHILWELAGSARLSLNLRRWLQQGSPEEAWQRITSDQVDDLWLQRLHEFLQAYGHVNASFDYLQPTMADEPAKAVQSIRMRMESESQDPEQQQRSVALERDLATVYALERLQRRPFRRMIFRWALSWAQEGASTREDIFFHALRGWPLARRAILRLGERLVDCGVLVCPEDVFFLTWEELQGEASSSAPADLRAMVIERRTRHERQKLLKPPARIPANPSSVRKKVAAWIKARLVGSATTSAKDMLWGAPVSPGVVTGPARIIYSVADADSLEPGNILVTPAATPEWSSTFSIVAGLITDVGGPLSHSSIIAREFGIPAVMGVRNGTTAIAEGQLVTVDGAKGSIQLHEMYK